MGAIDNKTYAAARKYTDNSIAGGGAVAGKNATVDSITDISGGHRVTFKWTLDNGTVQTDTMDVMDGAKGDTGAQGPKGDTGSTGAQGIQGVKGDTGAQGPKGDKGDTGATGAQGLQGIQGPKGDKGDDGYPFLIYKQYDDISEFDEDDFPEIGLMFMVMVFEEDKGYPIYRYTGEGTPPYSRVTYMNTEGIKGDKGDKGDTGAQGIQGEKGDKGDKGDQGDQGIQGIQGEQGEQGPTGATGAKGDKGDKGDTGEGVPEGGTAGQVLKKKSNTDFDTEWGEAASPLTFDSDDFDVSAQNAVSLDARQRIFTGTTAEWTALSAADKAKYTLVNLTDDAESLGSEIVDAVTNGVMNPVTSNAVFDAISDRLQHIHIDLAYTKTCTITIPSSSIGAIFLSGSRDDKCGFMQFYSYNASAQVMWYGTQPTGATITPDLDNHQITFGNNINAGSLAIDILCFVKTPTYIVN